MKPKISTSSIKSASIVETWIFPFLSQLFCPNLVPNPRLARLSSDGETLFVDDSVLVSHTANDIQGLVDKFAKDASQFSLETNTKNRSVLINDLNVTDEVPTAIKIENQQLTMCTNFTYVGSTVSEAAKIDQEITLRIEKASGEGRSSIYG